MRHHISPFLRQCIGGLALVGLGVTSAQAGYDEGLAAYQHGRYDTALQEFSAAAALGDARAQRSLGLMHERGEGLPRNAALAAEWYRKALAQGLGGAQYNLAFVSQEPSSGAQPTVRMATSRP